MHRQIRYVLSRAVTVLCWLVNMKLSNIVISWWMDGIWWGALKWDVHMGCYVIYNHIALWVCSCLSALVPVILKKSVNPDTIFANNEMSLQDTEIYGFDYDYTLAFYSSHLHTLIFNIARDILIEQHRVSTLFILHSFDFPVFDLAPHYKNIYEPVSGKNKLFTLTGYLSQFNLPCAFDYYASIPKDYGNTSTFLILWWEDFTMMCRR